MDDGLQGLEPIEPRAPIGIMPNRQHQTFHGFMKGAPYELAVVEFDDQGRCYDRGQMDGVAERLEALAPDDVATGEDVILVAFVHGWQHDARSDDDNLTAFRALLSETVDYERRHASSGVAPRPVLGVFVGWRGLSDFGLGDVVADATFWTRQAAGQRVAAGSVRELFGRMRHYRNRQQKRGGNPLLVIVGHSFGGMIVFSALAQSLIQAASAPVGMMTPEFADLVLLVNPAIEGARYIPIYDLVTSDGVQDAHDEAASGLHLRAGGERPAGRPGVSARQRPARDRRIDDRGFGEVVRHPCVRLRAEFPHPQAGGSDSRQALRARSARHPGGQSVLDGRRGERGDRRSWRHLAGAFSSVRRKRRLPACAGLEERP